VVEEAGELAVESVGFETDGIVFGSAIIRVYKIECYSANNGLFEQVNN
jgi:hypothetical protein